VGLVRQGCDQGSVTAVFQIAPDHRVMTTLQENGLECSGELILRRVQSADGRSRAFCNDQAVGIGLLSQIGSQLIEIHGQNESQALTDAATQRGLLDSFAGLTEAVASVGELFQARQSAR